MDLVKARVRKNAWAARNREHLRSKNAAYRIANKEREVQRVAAWRERNRHWTRTYAAVWRRDNLEYKRAYLSTWGKANRGKTAAHTAKRRAVLRQAAPAWADQNALAAIYAEAAAKGMHVDHIVPLQSELVCGLHVHNNLQILPGVENLRKGNRFWPDMP